MERSERAWARLRHPDDALPRSTVAPTPALAELLRRHPLPALHFELLLNPYETDKVLPQVRMPLLILHGRLDGLIPIEMGERLLAIANPPKELVAFPEGRHNNLYTAGQDAQLKVMEWWERVKGP